MRLLQRNLKTVYYCLFLGKEPIVNEDGYETGEYKMLYSDPVDVRCNVSPRHGRTEDTIAGAGEFFDVVLIVDDLNCPVDEHSVFFVEKEPEIDDKGRPVYDYTVRRVAKSLNVLSVALDRVKVS